MRIIHSSESEFLPAGHEDPKAPGVLIKKLLQKDDLVEGGVQMVNWALLPTGKAFRAHYHQDMQEVFILLKDNAKMTVDKEQAEITKGDAVVVPIGSAHKMENIGTEDVEYVVFGITEGKGGKTMLV